MTRLLVLSNLHLEHHPDWTLPRSFPAFDVALFPGDIEGSPARAIELLASAPNLAGRSVVYVPGNHEFYRGTLEQRLQGGRDAAVGINVHTLDRRSVVLLGVRFVGAILWTDYALFGDPVSAQLACLRSMNDHRLIATTVAGREQRFMPGHALARHKADREFIERELARPFAGPTLVVTHHAPHPGSQHPRYARDFASAGFASDLGGLIRSGRPTLWVHGHVHDSFDYMVGATRVLCTPKGYGPTRARPRTENEAFDAAMIVEVPTAGLI